MERPAVDDMQLKLLERQCGVEMMPKILAAFLGTGHASIAAVHVGVANQDMPEIQRALHNLLGSAGFVGPARLLAACRALQVADTGQEMAAIADEIAASFAAVEEALCARYPGLAAQPQE